MTQPPAPGAWTGSAGQLVLDLKPTWGGRAMISPQLRINGRPAPVSWGRNELAVFPGELQVEITCTYLWQYGRAADTVPVAPNSRVEAYYSAPYFTFLPGRIGPVPQPHRGRLAGLILLIFLGLVIVLIILGVALGS